MFHEKFYRNSYKHKKIMENKRIIKQNFYKYFKEKSESFARSWITNLDINKVKATSINDLSIVPDRKFNEAYLDGWKLDIPKGISREEGTYIAREAFRDNFIRYISHNNKLEEKIRYNKITNKLSESNKTNVNLKDQLKFAKDQGANDAIINTDLIEDIVEEANLSIDDYSNSKDFIEDFKELLNNDQDEGISIKNSAYDSFQELYRDSVELKSLNLSKNDLKLIEEIYIKSYVKTFKNEAIKYLKSIITIDESLEDNLKEIKDAASIHAHKWFKVASAMPHWNKFNKDDLMEIGVSIFNIKYPNYAYKFNKDNNADRIRSAFLNTFTTVAYNLIQNNKFQVDTND